MADRSNNPRLLDIIDASEFIHNEMADLTLDAFEQDRRKRWSVERGIEIISEASRRLSADLKARHLDIPWPKVAGIGNVLRHEYENVSPPVLWKVAREDLPQLEKVCREELAAAQAREQDNEGT
jgi:uncharacterized protein with HEPN domain